MRRLTKSNLKTQRKKIKPSSSIEQKLLDYFKRTVKLDFNKIKNIDDLQNALRKIDYRKLTRYINQTGIDIFRRNYDGYKGIMDALMRGTQNKQRQKQLDLAFQSMVQDRKIMQPLMDRFNYNVSLIKNIPQDIIAKLQKAYGEGVSFRGTEVEQYVKERLGKRAKLIIRTESAKLNSALTEVRSLKLGLRAYIWSTSEDRRVRASHKMMDGVLVFWGTRLELDKMVGNAGEFPNCFPGNELINPAYGIQKLYRRFYTGSICEITLDNGTIIRATPNHPFYTGSAFKSIDSFNVGDDFIEIRGNNFPRVPIMCEYDRDECKPSFEQIYTAFSFVVGCCTHIRSLGGEFHNDCGIDEEIDIIDIEAFLSNDIKMSLLHKFEKFILKQPKFSISTRLFSHKCPMMSSGVGIVGSAQCDVCRECILNVLLTSTFGHHQTVGLCACSALNFIFSQYPIDDCARASEYFCKRQNTAPIIILLDYLLRREFWMFTNNISCGSMSISNIPIDNTIKHRIVRKQLTPYSGYVYNLQSDYGYYTIKNNICQHNCRCVPLSVFELDDIKFPIKVAEGNLSIISKKDKAQIVSGQIRTYTREQFIKQYGDRFQ